MQLCSGRDPGLRVSIGMLAIRLVAGIAFMHHGWMKVHHPLHWMGPTARMPAVFQLLAAISEYIGGFAWIIGAVTPLFSFGILCTMSVALWTVIVVHGAPFVAKGPGLSFELPLLFWTIALLFLLAGPGRFSVDALICSRHK